MKQAPSAKTLEQIRTNARRRLIGAIILVILAIAILPLVLESKPREAETEVDVSTVAITTPEVGSPGAATMQQPVTPPAETASGTESAAVPATTTEQPAVVVPEPAPLTTSVNNPFFQVEGAGQEDHDTEDASPSSPDNSAISEGSPVQQTSSGYAVRPVNRPVITSKLKPGEHAPAAPIAPVLSDAARAAALLGEDPSRLTRGGSSVSQTASTSQKFVIQVGAYSDTNKVKEVQAKLSQAGFKSYTEEANTNNGRVTRVRVGPVQGRANADTTAEKIQALGLPVSILPG